MHVFQQTHTLIFVAAANSNIISLQYYQRIDDASFYCETCSMLHSKAEHFELNTLCSTIKLILTLDHGHTHSANHDEVFQWSICHSALKSSSGGVFTFRELQGKRIKRTSSETI